MKAKKYLISTAEDIREGRVARAIANLRLPVTWSVAVNKDVAEALIRVAENGEDADGAGVFGGCDVIAIATHGYSGLQRWATGSIKERILHATKLPLLIVRPPDVTDKSHVAWGETAVAVI
jgi:nucleotide-binding universal stress UspA family protein